MKAAVNKKCSKAALLTVHINSRRLVACPSNITCHAGIIAAILQSNSFKVQASIAANINVGVGNQLPEERYNILPKKILNIYFGMQRGFD